MKNLISAADITTYTAAQLVVEAHRLEVTIPEAQQRHLRPLVGPALLLALLALVADAPEPEPANALASDQLAYTVALAAWRTKHGADKLLALYDQVKPCLAQWALVEAWPNLLVHITNAGVVVKTGKGEGTTTADAALLGHSLSAYRDTAIWRGQELIRWLESNKGDYPAYVSTTPVATGRRPIGGIEL